MNSTLIRYTDSKYADDYMNGDLYMSSLFKFWDLEKGRINYYDAINGKVSEEKYKQALEFEKMRQQDFSEGVASQFPWDQLPEDIKEAFGNFIIHDARFRVEAYGYCNLLCFYRVDTIDCEQRMPVDKDNLSYLLEQKGVSVLSEEIRTLNQVQLKDLFSKVIPVNPLLDRSKNHMIQLPARSMDRYGDMVVLIKDEVEFVNRIAEAVKRQGGEYIAGNIKYHKIKDRSNPDELKERNHVSVYSSGGKDDGLFDMKEMLADKDQIIRYGCLDKYDVFEEQKEWRICWMPEVRNRQDKTLHVGSLQDIIEIIPRENIRSRLLEIYPGYIPGFVNKEGRSIAGGTMTYSRFKQFVENIDGKGRLFFDIG